MLRIEYLNIEQLKLYEGNAKRHPREQVEEIQQSIVMYGMNDPIGVWGPENVIVEGHGRYMACKALGMHEVPVIRLDHMTDKQRRAYTHVHNKTQMDSGFDFDILGKELKSLPDLARSFDFGLPMVNSSPQMEKPVSEDSEKPQPVSEPTGPEYFGAERERTANAYNMWEFDPMRAAGRFQIPRIKRCDYVPDDLIGFNYMLTTQRRDAGIHFFIDDYQFERVWNSPQMYIERMEDFPCVLTPDFSLYRNMSAANKIWNVYRSRMVGQMCQDHGLQVIPTLQWAEPDTFNYVFDGLERGGTVAVSTVGCMTDPEAFRLWCRGMDEAIRRLEPAVVVCYGSEPDYKFKGTRVKYISARKFGKGD